MQALIIIFLSTKEDAKFIIFITIFCCLVGSLAMSSCVLVDLLEATYF